MANAANNLAYTAGNFALTLDDEGGQSTAYLKSADGGFVSAAIVDEPHGGEPIRVKHAAVASIEPFSVEFGMAGAWGVLKWISDSWKKKYSRRHGNVTHADFNLNEVYTHEFSDALISETTFPTLDGGSKEGALIKMKFLPERVSTQTKSGANINDQNIPKNQKMWLSSGFRFTIDGLDETKYANKIEAFTIKQGIKPFYTGADRFPSIEPTKIEFPNIVGTIAAGYGTGLQQWYEQCVANGMSDAKSQRTGALEFLAPDKSTVLFRINFFECGLLSYKLNPSTANSGEIKRARFEMFVSRMELDPDTMKNVT